MKILIACEFSGIVREAFNARAGCHATSCDLLPPADGRTDNHIQGDVLTILNQGWDMIIAHPPCTYLCGSGLHWNKRRPERAAQTEAALRFVLQLWAADCPRIAIENPVGILSRAENLGKPAQIIQPHQFGHDASKATCLWLKNLPGLKPTQAIAPRMVGKRPRWANQTDSGQNKLAPSPDRWKLRAATYAGIADAMADQWSRL